MKGGFINPPNPLYLWSVKCEISVASMKGGFINPPNRGRPGIDTPYLLCFNEGRVYKPAELKPHKVGLYVVHRFNEGRVYKPAEPRQSPGDLAELRGFNEGRVYKPAELISIRA